MTVFASDIKKHLVKEGKQRKILTNTKLDTLHKVRKSEVVVSMTPINRSFEWIRSINPGCSSSARQNHNSVPPRDSELIREKN